jgi:hypothetical protein
MKRTKREKVILLVSPVGAIPTWWPSATEVTVSVHGGWVAGVDYTEAFDAELLEEVKYLWRTTRNRRRWIYEVRKA